MTELQLRHVTKKCTYVCTYVQITYVGIAVISLEDNGSGGSQSDIKTACGLFISVSVFKSISTGVEELLSESEIILRGFKGIGSI